MVRSGTLAGTDRPLPNLLSIAHHEGITNGRHSPMSLQRGKVASERVWDDYFRPFCPIFGWGCSRGALEIINQSILQITFSSYTSHHIFNNRHINDEQRRCDLNTRTSATVFQFLGRLVAEEGVRGRVDGAWVWVWVWVWAPLLTLRWAVGNLFHLLQRSVLDDGRFV